MAHIHIHLHGASKRSEANDYGVPGMKRGVRHEEPSSGGSPGLKAAHVSVEGHARYAAANGKRPSGAGSWIFSPHASHSMREHGSAPGEHYYQSPHNTNFTAASAEAKKWGASKGHRTMYVQS